VRSAAEPVIEIAADSPQDLLRIAWHLGNRHLPLQALRAAAHPRRSRHRRDGRGLGGHVTRLDAPFDPEIALCRVAQGHDHDS